MKRRNMIGIVAAAMLPSIRLGAAETPSFGSIGWLSVASKNETEEQLAVFLKAMASAGLIEGRDFVLEVRSTNGINGALPAAAEALVVLGPRVIVAEGARGVLAAMNATNRIPIVAPAVSESVIARVAGSNLAHPAINVTGLAIATEGVQAKLFEFAAQIVPDLKRVGFLVDAALAPFSLPNARQAAEMHRFELVTSTVDGSEGLARGVADLINVRPDAIIVPLSATFRAARATLVETINASRIPAVYGGLSYGEVGALVAFGSDAAASSYKAAAIVVRLLRGEKPSSIPIEVLPLKLKINLKTAQALGISIPPALLARADEVIE